MTEQSPWWMWAPQHPGNHEARFPRGWAIRGSYYMHAHDYGGDTIDGNSLSTFARAGELLPIFSSGRRVGKAHVLRRWEQYLAEREAARVAIRQAVLQAMGRPAMEEWPGL